MDYITNHVQNLKLQPNILQPNFLQPNSSKDQNLENIFETCFEYLQHHFSQRFHDKLFNFFDNFENFEKYEIVFTKLLKIQFKVLICLVLMSKTYPHDTPLCNHVKLAIEKNLHIMNNISESEIESIVNTFFNFLKL